MLNHNFHLFEDQDCSILLTPIRCICRIRLHLQVGQKTEQSLSHINMVDIRDLTKFTPVRSMKQEPVMSTTRLGGVIIERMYARS
ncbi:MAG: hypothetical protein EBZ68_06405 [Actinobacteria bacterium]|nr:hypothetical protein [Actinomycetota bacterium]